MRRARWTFPFNVRQLGKLGQAALEKPPLRLLPREGEGALVGRAGVVVPSEPAAEIGARGMGEVIVRQIAAREDRIDQREPGSRARRASSRRRPGSARPPATASPAAARRRAPRSAPSRCPLPSGASACTAAIAAWSVYGPNWRDASARSTSATPSAICSPVPQRAVLVGQQDQLALRRAARGAPRFLQQHEREQPRDLGLGQQLQQQPSQPDRLARHVVPRERRARRRRIAFVEHEVDHAQHGVQPLRQLGARRHLVRDARVADLRLGAHDALGERGRAGEKGARDLLGREPAHFAQRERDLRVRRQRRVAAREDEPQPVVLDALVVRRRAPRRWLRPARRRPRARRSGRGAGCRRSP